MTNERVESALSEHHGNECDGAEEDASSADGTCGCSSDAGAHAHREPCACGSDDPARSNGKETPQ
jgi:hypothetical protein